MDYGRLNAQIQDNTYLQTALAGSKVAQYAILCKLRQPGRRAFLPEVRGCDSRWSGTSGAAAERPQPWRGALRGRHAGRFDGERGVRSMLRAGSDHRHSVSGARALQSEP